jgi:hypothetical protein
MSATFARLKKVSGSFDADLKVFLQKYNLKMSSRRTVVSPDGEVTLKIVSHDTALTKADGTAVDPIVESYKRNCMRYGLKPEWLGKAVTFGDKTFRVAGLNTRKRKNSVVLETMNGVRSSRCSPLAIQQRIGR